MLLPPPKCVEPKMSLIIEGLAACGVKYEPASHRIKGCLNDKELHQNWICLEMNGKLALGCFLLPVFTSRSLSKSSTCSAAFSGLSMNQYGSQFTLGDRVGMCHTLRRLSTTFSLTSRTCCESLSRRGGRHKMFPCSCMRWLHNKIAFESLFNSDDVVFYLCTRGNGICSIPFVSHITAEFGGAIKMLHKSKMVVLPFWF